MARTRHQSTPWASPPMGLPPSSETPPSHPSMGPPQVEGGSLPCSASLPPSRAHVLDRFGRGGAGTMYMPASLCSHLGQRQGNPSPDVTSTQHGGVNAKPLLLTQRRPRALTGSLLGASQTLLAQGRFWEG